MKLASTHLSHAAYQLSNAIDEAGDNAEAFERIADECRELETRLRTYAKVVRSTPKHKPLMVPEMDVYGG